LSYEGLLLGWRWANQLPHHVLVQIFGNLLKPNGPIPSLLRVETISRSWKEAARASPLWKKLKLPKGGINVTALKNILKNVDQVEEVSLSNGSINSIFPLLFACGSNIKRLDLNGCFNLNPRYINDMGGFQDEADELTLGGHCWEMAIPRGWDSCWDSCFQA
jgi:hypothetical protein